MQRSLTKLVRTLTTMPQSNGTVNVSFPPSNRIQRERGKGLDVWTVFSPLSGYVPADSINLGQGFMNWAPPKIAQDGVKHTLDSPLANHYSIPKGRIGIRKAVSQFHSASYRLGRALDPDTEIIITSGANLGIYLALMTYCHPGDEVIVFEPFFDQYLPNIRMVDGVPVCVAMRPPEGAATSVVPASEWKIDPQDFKNAITEKTRIVILNSPQNPVGKVMTEAEIREIGTIAAEHNLMIISDEVYDVMAYEPAQHVRTAAVDDLWHRTVTVGSAGKAFAATGWRIGWLVGPEEIIKPIIMANTRTTFSCNSPMQEAVSYALDNAGDFFDVQRKEYVERKAVLTAALDKLGLPYTNPDGAYFIMINIERLEIPDDFEVLDIIKDKPRDWHAAWFVAKTAGVVLIPPSDFYSDEHKSIGCKFLRIAFCKDLKTLEEASQRLLKLRPYIRPLEYPER